MIPARRPLAAMLALAMGFVPLPAGAQLNPYKTADCFAFWKLKEKLDRDGVGDIVAAGPKSEQGGLPEAQMERVNLYLDLEEKLRFRCPDFAPPPDRMPGAAAPAPAPPPQHSGPPLPPRNPAR